MDHFKLRGNIILGIVGLIFAVYIGRLFSIQVLSAEYARKAESYVIRTKSVVPPRGNIYSRTGKIYVSNRPMFTLKVTPNELAIHDTTALLKILEMSKEELDDALAHAVEESGPGGFREVSVARYIEPEAYGAIQERIWDFAGLSFPVSNKRYYRDTVGAHVLGYIGEVNEREIKEHPELYKQGDFIGKSGIERSHDAILRGEQGERKVIKDVFNREVGRYANGKYDVEPVKGKDILLGIDTDLQAFGEALMQNKKGSIVAIEPATGEILAFVSAPAYQPAKLTGKELRPNFKRLQRDTLKPLFNRPIMAQYPPGSIFKIPVALAALNEGTIVSETYYSCGGAFWRNRGKPACRYHATPLGLHNAIKLSCNSYFAATYMDFLHHPKFKDIYESFGKWYQYMADMGIGRSLEVDMPYEKTGRLPTTNMYDNEKRWYGRNRWNATTIISNAIGQGEIEMTPLQMANLAALVANRGKYLQPHFLRAVRANRSDPWVKVAYDTVHTGIAVRHYETVVDAMEAVVAQGTARRAFIPDISVCGKTGTAQNPHGEDHAVFIGFAPKDRPRIAVAVVVENAGGGGRWAAPIGSLMMEQYLKGKIISKPWEVERIKQANFIQQK